MKKISAVLLLVLLLALATIGAVSAKSLNHFEARLWGEPDGTDSKAAGQAIFKVVDGGTAIEYKLIVANIENVSAAHIHLVPVGGVNGPPVVWLYPSSAPGVLIPGKSNGILMEGRFDETDFVGPLAGAEFDALVDAIVAGRTYVNVHTAQHALGEIRGPIK